MIGIYDTYVEAGESERRRAPAPAAQAAGASNVAGGEVIDAEPVDTKA